MFQEQQSSYPNFSSYLIPNSNPSLSYSVLSQEPIIHSPGFDPHVIPTRFQAPPALEEDPFAASKNEVITQTDTITVEHADRTLSETTMVSTLHSSWNYGMVSQHLVNDMIVTEQPSEMIQSVQCEVCKITCNTKDAFKKHLQGKKHKKNLQMLSFATVQNNSDAIHNESSEVSQHLVNDVIVTEQPSKIIQSIQCEVCKIVCNSKDVLEVHVQGKKHKKNLRLLSSVTLQNSSESNAAHNESPDQMLPDVVSLTMEGELEKKKNKLFQNGVSVDSLLFCKICNVVCNNQVVFSLHLAGRKHATQAATKLSNGAKLSENATQTQASGELQLVQSTECEICKISCNSSDNFNRHISGKKHLKNLEISKKIIGSSEEPNKGVQSAWCEICKISCTSNDVLNIHISGKKHRKNLEKSKIVIGPPTSIVPMENPEASNGNVICPQEPKMEAKEFPESDNDQKHSEMPIEKDTKNIRTPWCDLCKIGCNSYDNLRCHIAGKMHRKNLEKLNKTIVPAPPITTTPIIGSLENPNPGAEKDKVVNSQKRKKNAKASNDDLEMKRQKMVKEGAASDSVRGCTICNVVCNSPMVFISHLAGHKHAAMAMKHAQSDVKAQNA